MIDLTNKHKLYHIYYKTKSNGSKRKICSPCQEIKNEQHILLNKLEKNSGAKTCLMILEELDLEEITLPVGISQMPISLTPTCKTSILATPI